MIVQPDSQTFTRCGYRMMEAIELLAVCLDTVPAGLD